MCANTPLTKWRTVRESAPYLPDMYNIKKNYRIGNVLTPMRRPRIRMSRV